MKKKQVNLSPQVIKNLKATIVQMEREINTLKWAKGFWREYQRYANNEHPEVYEASDMLEKWCGKYEMIVKGL